MISEKRIRDLIEEKIQGTDRFIVDLSVDRMNRISVEVDADGGIPISGCVEISRHIEGDLDRDDEDFSLEVASAGLDKPFRLPRQYKKNIGRKVVMRTREGTKIEGELIEATDTGIRLKESRKERVEGRKKKEWVDHFHDYAYKDIRETKVLITFK